MGRELTPAELRELLSVYALDAVDDVEREEVERYLDRSPEARAELAELREVASLLVQPDRDAPPTLWERIEESLAAEPPALGVPGTPRTTWRPLRRPLVRRLAVAGVAATVAALAVTVVLLSRDMSQQEDRLAALAQHLERGDARDAALALAADPRARTATLTWRDGHPSVPVVALPDGRGYLMGDHLPRLQRDRTYQLWAMSADERRPTLVSAAVLGPDPGVAAFHAPAATHGFVLTNERAPGVQRARGPVVAEGRFD